MVSLLAFIAIFFSAFTVTVPQAIVPVSATAAPQAYVASSDAITSTSVVLAIDTSNSMAGKAMRMLKEAAHNFVQSMDANTAVAIVTYSNGVQVVQTFTTDKSVLNAALDSIKSGGSRALYDGSNAAIALSTGSTAQRRIVVLISSGTETRGQSKATKDDALKLAKSRNVAVFAIGLGPAADRSFLEGLAQGTNGFYYRASGPDEIAALYSSVSSRFASVPADSATNTDPKAPGYMDSPKPVDGISTPPPSSIQPNVAPVTALTGPAGANTVATSNIVPITVNVPADSAIESADLSLNGSKLTTFSKPPFQYDFDTTTLNAGQYTLTFNATNDKGVNVKANLDFEVLVVTPPADPAAAPADPANATNTNTTVRPPQGTLLTAAQRVLLIDGKAQPFNLMFTSDKGLVAIAPLPTPSTLGQPETLSDILARPVNLIPAPIREGLMAQRPDLWGAVIILLTLVIMPQGLFTLYWMMYTWNNPEAAEKYRSPKVFAAPDFSFTAILPARREAAVIRQTIQAVNAIDYPAELKEILVMIRDDDDDETIAQAKQAIAESGGANIRLITFADGPKNKPNGLNRGLRASTKDVICVFDAEDSPHPEIYNVVNTVMVRDAADVVQSGVQLMNIQSNWFSALNCLEYFFWFKSGLHCFTRSLNVTPLGGNTVFFKKPWLQRINGWDEKCLTEDADVGLRLTLLGAKMQIVYDAKHATQEETPADAQDFIKQRTRWCQGFYEIFFKWDWIKLPSLKQKLTAFYILLNSLLQAAVVFYLPVGIYVMLTQRIAVPIAMLSCTPFMMLIIQLLANVVGIHEFAQAYNKKLPFLFSLRMALSYYPFQLMLAISAARAVLRFISRKNAWEKTTHTNLHREAQAQVVGRSV